MVGVGIDGSEFVITRGPSGSSTPGLRLCGMCVSLICVMQEMRSLRVCAVPLETVLTLVEDRRLTVHGGCVGNAVRSSERGQRFRRVGRTSRSEG